MVHVIKFQHAYTSAQLQLQYLTQITHTRKRVILFTIHIADRNAAFRIRSRDILGKCLGMATHSQSVVCTGVRTRLRKLFPEADSHYMSLCLRCQMPGIKKQTEMCRFQGVAVEIFF